MGEKIGRNVKVWAKIGRNVKVGGTYIVQGKFRGKVGHKHHGSKIYT